MIYAEGFWTRKTWRTINFKPWKTIAIDLISEDQWSINLLPNSCPKPFRSSLVSITKRVDGSDIVWRSRILSLSTAASGHQPRCAPLFGFLPIAQLVIVGAVTAAALTLKSLIVKLELQPPYQPGCAATGLGSYSEEGEVAGTGTDPEVEGSEPRLPPPALVVF